VHPAVALYEEAYSTADTSLILDLAFTDASVLAPDERIRRLVVFDGTTPRGSMETT
jgi:hypothetical protein